MAGGEAGTLALWDIALALRTEPGQGARTRLPTLHDVPASPIGAFAAAALADGSAMLASGHDDGMVCVWAA